MLACSAKSGVQFALQVLDLAPVLVAGLSDAEAQSFLTKVSEAVDQLSLFWNLATAAQHTLLKQSARFFGFGIANFAGLGSCLWGFFTVDQLG